MLLLAIARPAGAYSVLAHESNVDAVWDDGIVPVLKRRFPRTTKDELAEARAYAYGGCVIQDLGYYPFGNHFFSDLLHYVRTGDFVETLVRDSRDVNELAFALGALAHYAADSRGHPIAVNRAVPLVYPKLRAKFGDRVTYAQAPKNHVMVEFSFDVVQAVSGAYAPEMYHKFIGFKVATPALERAVRETYGIEMKDLFVDMDLAIGTYRHAVSSIIPEMTKVAWRDRHDEILKVAPQMQQAAFVFELSPKQYEEKYGSNFAKPRWYARVFGVMFTLLPKIGPFRVLAFEVPTPEAERLFVESLAATRDQFRSALTASERGQLRLENRDLDTGNPTALGEYTLADKTYETLVEKLAKHKDHSIPKGLAANITAYYGSQRRHNS